jgi:transposase
VRDRLQAAGWKVDVAHARKVRDVAPLACKTDKVDARVLAELCRRDLVPALWVPSLDERALRERLRRRTHLVRMRGSAQNRIFGLLTQWGLRLSLDRLRAPDATDLLAARGVPAVWRRSIAEALAVIDLLDQRLAPIERELRQLAAADPRVLLLRTIPGIGDLLGLTIATEIGDVSRFSTPRKLIGYAGLAPRANQSGDRARIGALSKAGSRTLRWAARRSRPSVLAAVEPVACALQRHRQARRQEPRQVRRRAQSPDRRLARPVPQPALQAESPPQQQRRRPPSCLGKLPLLSGRLTALHGIEKPRQLPRTLCDHPSAEREMSSPPDQGARDPTATGRDHWTPDGGRSPPRSSAGRRRQARPPVGGTPVVIARSPADCARLTAPPGCADEPVRSGRRAPDDDERALDNPRPFQRESDTYWLTPGAPPGRNLGTAALDASDRRP